MRRGVISLINQMIADITKLAKHAAGGGAEDNLGINWKGHKV